MRKAGLPQERIQIVNITKGYGTWKKKTFIADLSKQSEFEAKLSLLRPDFIVVNDRASLRYITGKYVSLAVCRGGIYYWKGIPCLVVDDIARTNQDKAAPFFMMHDLRKLQRWLHGQQRAEPALVYRVCKTIPDLEECQTTALASRFITCDIETTGQLISSVGYSCWTDEGKVLTFVIPFIDGASEKARTYWDTDASEIAAWNTITTINRSNVAKSFQNGMYDNSFFLRYGIATTEFVMDTMHLWHSIWTEAAKGIDDICSVALDYYTYWKDEASEETKKKAANEKKDYLPATREGMEKYWLYNALDCHNQALATRWLVMVITQPEMSWALQNYVDEFALNSGPFMSMTATGIRFDQDIQREFRNRWISESASAERDLKIMVGDDMFNANSTPQVQELIYDVLGAEPVGRGEEKFSIDEKFLKIIQTQSPLLDIIIEQIWAVKKPANNASKYGAPFYDEVKRKWRGLALFNNRMMFQISATTETGRGASRRHPLKYGTNAQNIPAEARPMFEADPGYVLFEDDYDRSDAYFTAFDLEDQKYISVMQAPGLDQHCFHAEYFFKIPYDKILQGKKDEAEWVVHSTKGVRQITKRIVYGANYLMAAYTMFITMGRKAVVAAAEHLGHKDAEGWSAKQLIQLCETFINAYFTLYPDLKSAVNRKVQQAVANGNKLTCAFGRTRLFFGDIAGNEAIKRELAAYVGQGGTAGNINRGLRNIWYTPAGRELRKEGVILLSQIHDSVKGQVPEGKLWLLPEVKKLMENECELHGRKFTVPVGIKVGRGWGKRCLPYHDGITLAEIDAHDRKWKEKFYGHPIS